MSDQPVTADRGQRGARPAHRKPDPQCPLRPGDPCTLCQYDVTGPHDCPLVYLVMHDPDDRAAWVESRANR